MINLIQELLEMEVERLHILVRLIFHNKLDLLKISVLLELCLDGLHPLLDLPVFLEDKFRLLIQFFMQVSFFGHIVVIIPRFTALVSISEIVQVLYFLLVRKFEFIIVSKRVYGPLDHVVGKAYGLLDDALNTHMLLFHVDFRLLLSQICDTYEIF